MGARRGGFEGIALLHDRSSYAGLARVSIHLRYKAFFKEDGSPGHNDHLFRHLFLWDASKSPGIRVDSNNLQAYLPGKHQAHIMEPLGFGASHDRT
jgi:hypothetical protein